MSILADSATQAQAPPALSLVPNILALLCLRPAHPAGCLAQTGVPSPLTVGPRPCPAPSPHCPPGAGLSVTAPVRAGQPSPPETWAATSAD